MIFAFLLASVGAIPVDQVHVASGPSVDSATVAWSTRFNCTNPEVRIGKSPCRDTSCFTATYYGSSTDLTTGNNTQFVQKVMVLVKPSTTYNYQVGCSNGWSSIFSYRPAKLTGPNTFVIFGDLSTAGEGKPTWDVLTSRLNTLSVDAIIHVGDLAYDLFDDDNRHGDDYMNYLAPVISRIPYMVIAGNHEKADGYRSYDTRYAMPGNNFYHTYTIGLVRFVGINTEFLLYQDELTQPTLDFMASTLNRTEADKQAYPWLVVLGHRPLYCTMLDIPYPTCDSEAATLRNVFESLLYENGVDLYVDGHVHNYQRTTPVYNGTTYAAKEDVAHVYYNPQAPIHVTTGGPGNDESQTPLYPNATLSWFVTGTAELTYSVVNVYNSTHLWWEQWYTNSNSLADSFWVIKTPKAIVN